MTIEYEIKFFDYWHISSGLSGGAALDSYVVKDERGLPYVPGKTIKGLAREMAELFASESDVQSCFGKGGATKIDDEDTTLGQCRFTNAVMKGDEADEIVANNLTHNLFNIISATKIDDVTGTAADGSLRDIEVVIPINLIGSVKNVPEEFGNVIQNSLKMIKRMGLNRNRGLGRCEFVIKEQR
ncbi:MAG: RAMP superfamily CRISPR-associated protein [Campylobacter sp.]|nr:RAMP superfamily CRISPR-associated protein [Campylobacter sp.]